MYVLPSQRQTTKRAALVRAYTNEGWTLIETTQIRNDIWLRFRCGA